MGDDFAGGCVLGFLTCAVIGGFWIIGSGLMNAAQVRRRKPLAIVRDSEQDAG